MFDPTPRAGTRLPSWLGRVAGALPNRCAVCQAGGSGPEARLCGDCLACFAPLRPRCERCALQLPAAATVCGRCVREPPPWTHAVAACDYGYPWDGLLGALKFEAAIDLAPVLALQLARAVEARALPPIDVLLPVPLAPLRLRERGYNQALLLAQPLARRFGLRVAVDALQRPVETPHQVALPREQRVANVRGAFLLDRAAVATLRGRHVAVVDDVMTTGATIGEVTRVLHGAGVASVQAWVVARTPP
ncbi:ComF family protein [uncultured Methylibium sp.]|uniref:ComF family protein n=1 Tax=uncultured Methylibium sp. TaxID=381093 RepID=UPI0025FF3643|nr:ComF family protein [uncultured Methylibium sp.]